MRAVPLLISSSFRRGEGVRSPGALLLLRSALGILFIFPNKEVTPAPSRVFRSALDRFSKRRSSFSPTISIATLLALGNACSLGSAAQKLLFETIGARNRNDKSNSELLSTTGSSTSRGLTVCSPRMLCESSVPTLTDASGCVCGSRSDLQLSFRVMSAPESKA